MKMAENGNRRFPRVSCLTNEVEMVEIEGQAEKGRQAENRRLWRPRDL